MVQREYRAESGVQVVCIQREMLNHFFSFEFLLANAFCVNSGTMTLTTDNLIRE